MSGRSSESSWWVDRLWSSLLYRVADSALAVYWCGWRCLVDLQRAAGGLTGCGAACCTGLQTVVGCLLVYVEMSGRSSETSWWVDRLWSSLLYQVANSGLLLTGVGGDVW